MLQVIGGYGNNKPILINNPLKKISLTLQQHSGKRKIEKTYLEELVEKKGLRVRKTSYKCSGSGHKE